MQDECRFETGWLGGLRTLADFLQIGWSDPEYKRQEVSDEGQSTVQRGLDKSADVGKIKEVSHLCLLTQFAVHPA